MRAVPFNSYAGPDGLHVGEIAGEEVAGVVDEVGDGVNHVAVGDAVLGFAVSRQSTWR